MSKMRLMAWADSPSVPTGFGVVMKNLLPRFQTMGYDVVTLGINEFGFDPRTTAAFPFPIYPCRPGSPEQIYGFDRLWGIVENEKPDVLFLLNDPWLIQNAMAIKPKGVSPYLKTVGYYPTDAAPLKPDWHEALNGLDAQVCYSHYAEGVVTKSNGGRPSNLHQVYHGVDTTTFFPMNQSVARRFLGIPEDLFIVGMVARNQPRKRFDLLMLAFAEFAKDKPKVKLYLHTALKDIGFDILDIARQLNIADKLILTENLTPNQGVSESRLNYIYNSFDVNALISLGDGFGLPVAESMATGCAQIVSGNSCLQELVEGGEAGLVVKNAAYILNPSGINTWGSVSDVVDLTYKLNILYKSQELRIKYAESGYRFITSPSFNWDKNAEKFDKIFKSLFNILEV